MLSRISGPWLLAGDWNCTPDELAATGWLQLVGGEIVAPKTATCNDRILDFFVVAQQFRHNVLDCRTVCDAGLNPHSPARIYLNDRAVTAWVRQPAPVPSLPAILPHGPVSQRSSEASLVHDGETLDE